MTGSVRTQYEKILNSKTFFEFYWEERGTNTANGTTEIAWEYVFYGEKGGFYGDSDLGDGYPYEIWLDNSSTPIISGSAKIPYMQSSRFVIANGVTRINHDNNGYAHFAVHISQKTMIEGNIYVDGDFTLETRLNMPSSITDISPAALTEKDKPIISYYNPYNTNRILSLYVDVGGENVAVRTDLDLVQGARTYQITFTAEEEARIIELIPQTGISAEMSFSLSTTIDGIHHIKTMKRIVSIKSPAPTVRAVVYDTNDIAIEYTGDNTKFIKGVSNAYIKTNANAGTGSTLTSHYIKNGNTEVKFNGNIDSYTFEGVENKTFYLGATNSRGLSVSSATVIDLIPYTPITCNKVNIDKFTASGELSFTIAGKWFSDNFGARDNHFIMNLSILAEDNTTVYTSDSISVNPMVFPDYDYVYTHNLTGVDYRQAVRLIVSIEDAFTSSGGIDREIAPIPIFDWSKTDFNFNVPVHIKNEPIADFIVEVGQEDMGSNGTWYWAKWSSGKSECYGCRNYGNTSVNNSWGNLFRSEIFTQSLPYGLFEKAPEVVNIALAGGSYGGWIVTSEQDAPTNISTGSFMIVRPAGAIIEQAYISFYVIGRWR